MKTAPIPNKALKAMADFQGRAFKYIPEHPRGEYEYVRVQVDDPERVRLEASNGAVLLRYDACCYPQDEERGEPGDLALRGRELLGASKSAPPKAAVFLQHKEGSDVATMHRIDARAAFSAVPILQGDGIWRHTQELFDSVDRQTETQATIDARQLLPVLQAMIAIDEANGARKDEPVHVRFLFCGKNKPIGLRSGCEVDGYCEAVVAPVIEK